MKLKNKLSFSMMELLVAIGIILLMMSLILPTVGPMMARADLGRAVSVITGQLEVAYTKSLEKNKIYRVSFEFDPNGKGITDKDVLKITGTSSLGEYLDRQDPMFDLNGDGISGGNCNRQFFWIKIYLVKDALKSNVVKTIDDMIDDEEALGPYWIRRPLSRVIENKNSRQFIDSKLNIKPITDEAGNIWFARPLKNDGLDLGGSEKLMPVKLDANGNYFCDLLNEDGNEGSTGVGSAKIFRPTDMSNFFDELRKDTGPNSACLNVYNSSVALFYQPDGYRYKCTIGATVTNYLLTQLIAKGAAMSPPVVYTIKDLEPPDITYFDNFEGDMVNPVSMDYMNNDDEDKMIDEGMSVSVESYQQSDGSSLKLDFVKGILHNNYFSLIEDNNSKVGKEYFLGGKQKKGMILRRVWGCKPNQTKKVLLWSIDRIIDSFPGFNNLSKSTPFYFSIVFDQKNGSGMYFSNSFGSTQVGKLYFEISNDDNSLTTLVKFEEGAYKEGSLSDHSLYTSDLPEYYLGTK